MIFTIKMYIVDFFTNKNALLARLPENMNADFIISKNSSYIFVVGFNRIFLLECEHIQQNRFFLMILKILGIIIWLGDFEIFEFS